MGLLRYDSSSTMSSSDSDSNNGDDERVCYVMLSRRGGCRNAVRSSTRRCPMLLPDVKPALLDRNVSDDFWLTPFQPFIRERDAVQKQYSYFVEVWAFLVSWWVIIGAIYAVLPPGGGGKKDILDEEAVNRMTVFHFLTWIASGAFIFAAAAIRFRYLDRKQQTLEQDLVKSMKPKYEKLDYQMEYHATSQPCCSACFQQYSYSYLRIEQCGTV